MPPKRTAATAHFDDFDPSLGAGWDDSGGMDLMIQQRPDGTNATAFMPRFVTKLPPEAFEAFSALQNVVLEMQALREEMDELVQVVRGTGGSWAAVGWSVGITAEAARKRWGGGEQ